MLPCLATFRNDAGFLRWLQSVVPEAHPREYELDRLIPRKGLFELRIQVQEHGGEWRALTFQLTAEPAAGRDCYSLGSWGLVHRDPLRDPVIQVARSLEPETQARVGRLIDSEIVEASLHSYTPDRRSIICYRTADGTICFGKLYRPGRSADAFRTARGLRQAGLADCLTEPVVHLEDLELIVWRAAAGSLLAESYPGPAYREGLSRTGSALRRLHEANAFGLFDPPAREVRALVNEVEVLRTYLDRVANLIEWRPSELQSCYEELRRRCVGLEAPDAKILHGDFHDNQIVIAGSSAVLLDLDQVVRGDPAIDIGNFLAHIDFRIAYAQADDDPTSYSAAFLTGYGEQADADLGRRQMLAHAISLLRNCCLYILLPDRLQSLTAACRRTLERLK